MHMGRVAGCWLALVLLAGLWGLPARAETLRLDRSLCHAVTGLGESDARLATLRFTCSGAPTGYQQGSLWLRTRFDGRSVDGNNLVLMVHQSRFDRLAVAFAYADGVVVWRQVRSGDFGTNWRAGGQIALSPPGRAVPLVGLTMRYDRLTSRNLLHMSLLDRGEGAVQSAALAALIGAALTLLLIGGLYNLSLAGAVRRQYLAWHGAWAICMLLWGAFWSQLHLLILPGMAGSATAQSCTFLACMAVTLATIGAMSALGRGALPRAMRIGTIMLAVVIAINGVPLALMRGPGLDRMGELATMMLLADLLAVTICLAWAWRRGSREARDFSLSWAVPMATLTIVHLVDVESLFWGGGSKIVVLFAAAWQTLWLSIVSTRRMAELRIERDHARAAEAQAHELARRDPLTGLRNRRGFIEAIGPALDQARSNGAPVALLIVDIDRFKAINDFHGHEAGDLVLCTIARRLERWEGPLGTVARLGGEEFALMITGLEGFALTQFADGVRCAIAACDHRNAIGDQSVTASIGVAEANATSDFQQLYRLADAALYDAKRGGRDRIALRTRDGTAMSLQVPQDEPLRAVN